MNKFNFCLIAGGHHASLNTPLALLRNQYTTATGWEKTNSKFSIGAADATNENVVVTQDGIYIVSFTARLESVSGSVKVGVFINGTEFLQGRMQNTQASSLPESMALSLSMDLKYQDVLTFRVNCEDFQGQLISGTTRSVLRIDELASSNLTEGLSGFKTTNQPFTSGANAITGWDTKNTKGTFLAKNVSLTDSGAIVVLRPGVFRVTMAIIVNNLMSTRRYAKYIAQP